MDLDRSCNRFGPVWLAPGVGKSHAVAFLFASVVSIGFMTFINIGQAYVLNVHLGVPANEQGTISGDLHFFSELMVLCVLGGLGVMSDRIGRRPILVFGLLSMALAYVLYPLASSITELTVYRLIYAVGMAAGTGMMGTIVNDYPQEVSRGRMIAIGGVFNGLGILAVNLGFGRAPDWLVSLGFDAITAGRYTHWLVAAVMVPSAIILAFGLKGGTPAKKEARPPVSMLIRSGLREARNLKIALAYSSAFVARSDLVVIGAFSVLWGTLAGIDQGLSAADAVKRGSLLMVTANGAGLLWMPVMGLIVDRIDRVSALIIGAGMAAAAFLATMMIDSPLDSSSYFFFAMLGIGQVSCFFASQALVGQEAPMKERGSVIGVFGLCGAFGILLSTVIGGRLFDQWMPAGPFVLVGVGNLLVFIFAIFVRGR